METVGVRELKARASEIVEAVQTERKRYQVTKRGKLVALIVPVPNPLGPADAEDIEHDLAVWVEMDELAEEISRRWPKGISAVEALSADRR